MSGRGEAGLGRLRSTINARMEEMSFRSGAAVLTGAPVAAGVAITLAVMLSGHGAVAPSAPRPAAVARSAPPPSPVLPAAPPSATARATPAASVTPAHGYRPPAPAAVVTPPQASASSAAGVPTSRFPRPTFIGRAFPVAPDLGRLRSFGRPGAPEWRRDGRLGAPERRRDGRLGAPEWRRGGRLGRDSGGLPGRRLGRLPHGPQRVASASHPARCCPSSRRWSARTPASATNTGVCTNTGASRSPASM
jgi:hypothetical protein